MASASEREIGRELSNALHDSSGGYELVIGAIAAAAVGFALDTVIGITPVLTLVFACLGFVGATLSIYYRYKQQMGVAASARSRRVNAPMPRINSQSAVKDPVT